MRVFQRNEVGSRAAVDCCDHEKVGDHDGHLARSAPKKCFGYQPDRRRLRTTLELLPCSQRSPVPPGRVASHDTRPGGQVVDRLRSRPGGQEVRNRQPPIPTQRCRLPGGGRGPVPRREAQPGARCSASLSRSRCVGRPSEGQTRDGSSRIAAPLIATLAVDRFPCDILQRG